ncbi:MAG: 50S ribosomal protein L7/L12 [Waddliaceae bacterium]|nr:50S ribosomal protein L7/L12 [Waddliaceae bacterium]MBT4444787.1 50S ribosomal protein L7/L12 [Waddliaceae bacterium]MBT6928056.1 50S ribosomal protein L7/L12 [Waddliaceae bacterium]MBT7264440.1 50S ribosomal protein L7/L12 [Waddliaceae bacterium]MBT7462009.1 50S ribosomal protein L7/L12 [Waddliaceae bacterium]
MSKTEELVKELSKLTVLEMAELKKALEEEWGVEAAAAAVAVAAPAEGGAAQEAAEESTEFEVTLVEVPAAKKIAVIKIVRELTGLGLKEAKELVEAAPKVIKESVSKTESEEIVKKIEETGAKVTVKGL